MSDESVFEDFDFGELLDLDFREKNSIFELEKKRIQKLVEASDIEMTELLFNGCRALLDGEKKIKTVDIVDIVDIDKKKDPSKKVKCSLFNKNKFEKKRDLTFIKEVFGESEFIDPYDLKYGHIYSERFK